MPKAKIAGLSSSLTRLLVILIICQHGSPTTFTLPKKIRFHQNSADANRSISSETFLNSNPCLIKYCSMGQECITNEDDEAVCVCKQVCSGQKHISCGSDGYLYPNRCELYKAGCLNSKKITVEHDTLCARRGNRWAPGFNNDYFTSKRTTHSENFEEIFGLNDDNSDKQNRIDFGKDSATEDKSSKKCSLEDYEMMKDNLLLNNHAKLMLKEGRDKDYLVSIMFSNYDVNSNGNLEAIELQNADFLDDDDDDDDSNPQHNGCRLIHMIEYEDSDNDRLLNINEFYSAFSKLYSVSLVSLDEALVTNHLSVKIGDNVEIKCDVSGSPLPLIIWRKNNYNLANVNDEDIRIFNDGSLYVTKVQLQHAGNYTCNAQDNKEVVQTHILTVYTLPEVKVMPLLQSKRPGEHVIMYCHVIGDPFPTVEWLKNDQNINFDNKLKYKVSKSGASLEIFDASFSDTGAYMCRASNIGGSMWDISSLIVQESVLATAPDIERRFFAFFEFGVSIFEPNRCQLHHPIKSTDIIPGTQEYVCGNNGTQCDWGKAINVANRYIYASQPSKNRIVVISKIQMVVVDIVETDEYPVDLFYVPHLDMVWLLNWRSTSNAGIKTIQVIRNAGQKRKHYAIHPEPIDGQFDLVANLHLPDANQELSAFTYKYGFVTHTNQRGFYKLDLLNMRYTRYVDLTPYNCVPIQMQFSSLYGFVIIQCMEPVTDRPTGQLLLDYLTDTIIATNTKLFGVPFISPDSRLVVTLQLFNKRTKIIVQEIHSFGLKYAFDIETSLLISDVTYFPSQTSQSYDLFASAQNQEDILFLNLNTGKVEIIMGVGKASATNNSMWNNPNRPIAASGQFGEFMVTSAKNALYVINGVRQSVNCATTGISQLTTIVWTTEEFH